MSLIAYGHTGLRSYGKVVYVFTLVPVVGTLVLCAKLLGLNATGSIQHQLFPATVWSEFFINGKSWVAASNEVFLTWGLLGAAAMQVSVDNSRSTAPHNYDNYLVVFSTVGLPFVTLEQTRPRSGSLGRAGVSDSGS